VATPPHRLSVVVPMYNERDNAARLVADVQQALAAYAWPWELVVVDDGSTDGTGLALQRAAAATGPHVRVVRLTRNFRQTAAMQAGIDAARGELIATLDGDLQNDPADIPRLLAKLDEGYEVVSGWRKDRQDAAITRNLPSSIANRIISFISGVHLHDYGCSLKAYHRSVIKEVKLYGEMHRFIPIYASWQGARVAEIPVTHHARQFGKSKYGLERTVKVVLDLIVVKFLATFAQKPMYLFGSVGLMSLAVSLASGVWALFLKYHYDISFILTPLPLLFVMTAITGFMCILMGLLAELLTRTYHESQDKPIYMVRTTRNVDDAR
jgi:glycosyltransferase involved in cell wall biosynthesis